MKPDVDTLVAGAAVLWAHSAPPRRAKLVLGVALAAAFVPPVAHAAAWVGVGDAARRILDLAASPLAGLPAVVLAQSSAYLPLCLGGALMVVFALHRLAVALRPAKEG